MTDPWPQEQTDILVSLWKGGSSAGEIGIVMHLTRNQVMGKVSRLGLARGRQVNYLPQRSKPHEKRAPTAIKQQTATGQPVPFLEADHTTCRWPLWTIERTGNVCGALPIAGKSYCAYHHSIAFVALWSRKIA